MSEYLSKIKRQIEIVGKALTEEKFSIVDLAVEYNVEELTIKRDLSELRSRGIDIHSLKKTGIKILSPINKNLLKEFILEYISFSYSDDYPDKSTNILIEKHKEKALSMVVQLQQAIEKNYSVRIDYQATANTIKRDVLVNPLKIFQSQNDWRLLGINQNIVKQYYLSKILRVSITSEKFKSISKEKINSFFSSSLKSWIGTEEFLIKVKFEKNWAEIIKSKMFLMNQRITDLEDGSIIFEGVVNSLDEAATWILSFGKGAQILEPDSLRNKVIQLAKDALSNY